MVDISGRCPQGFGAVRDAFAENFEVDGDVGASVAVTLDGELVVDLWGGTQDVAGDGAVGGGHDHQRVLDDEDDVVPRRCSCCASRGLVDVDAPVSTYWPEFAAAGKERHGARAPPAVAHRRPAGLGRPPRGHRPLRLGQGHRPARRAGDVVGAGLEVRLPRHQPGQPRRRGRAPRRRSLRRHVLRRGDRRPARRRLPHRHRTGARRPRRARHPADRRRPAGPRRRRRGAARRTRSPTAPPTRASSPSSRGRSRGGAPRSPPPAATATPAASPSPSRSCRPAARRAASTCCPRR